MSNGEPFDIILAEDDEDDYLFTRDALAESHVTNRLHWVRDGEELLAHLRPPAVEGIARPRHRIGLILLDLNMPRMDGREALAEIKLDPVLRRIPVVVLTTSDAEDDVVRSYDLGVNSFIQKPLTFQDLTRTIHQVTDYWFQIVRLPS